MQPNLFIDGYNLMHAAGLARGSYGPGDLEKARDRLLSQLVNLLTEDQRQRTVVVFDAKKSVGFLGSSLTRDHITIVFPDRGVEADAVLEQMIRKHSAPRRLTVVSSDRRIQIAAKKRRATPVDSETFLADSERAASRPRGPEKPAQASVSEAEIEFWNEQLEDLLDD